MSGWSVAQMPDQTGRTVLVTGANSGLGYQTAVALARRGATVHLGCRNAQRAAMAADRIRRAAPQGRVEVLELDLADLGSIAKAAAELRARTGDSLDALINNAAAAFGPMRRTADGLELVMATNHLGPAALTWLLAPALRPGARVVYVTAIIAGRLALDVDDLNWDRRRFNGVLAYQQSKLAGLVFSHELDRRARLAGRDLVSVAAHPGVAGTDLVANAVRAFGTGRVTDGLARVGRGALAAAGQTAEQGALPQLHAATAIGVCGGDYFGPTRVFGTRGAPGVVALPPSARNSSIGARLWERTAALTGVNPDPA